MSEVYEGKLRKGKKKTFKEKLMKMVGRFNRPPWWTFRKVTSEMIEEFIRLRNMGMSYKRIGGVCGVNEGTVRYWLIPERRERERNRIHRLIEWRNQNPERNREISRTILRGRLKYDSDFAERMREHVREYSRKPEVKERLREYRKGYSRRPEVKERMREYRGEYMLKRGTTQALKWIDEKHSPDDPNSLFSSKEVLEALMFGGVALDELEKKVRAKASD